MKRTTLGVLVCVLLALLASGCVPAPAFVAPTATPKPDAYVGEWTDTTEPIDGLEAIYTSAAATVNAELTAAAPVSTSIPTNTSSPTQNPGCDVKDGSWMAMTNGNTISITFTVTDCKITFVMFTGTINGQWLIFSNSEPSYPINGSQFDFQHSYSDQDRYRLSGTFTSPMTVDIQMVIYKGFRITADQPSPFTDDMIINGTATP
jgi:hypothetical protein